MFGRHEVGASADAFIDGLLSGISRETGWLMAEQAGLDRPYRMQPLLGRSSWNADALRDLVRAEVLGSLRDPPGARRIAPEQVELYFRAALSSAANRNPAFSSCESTTECAVSA